MARPHPKTSRIVFLTCLEPKSTRWWTQEAHYTASGARIVSKNCTPLHAPYLSADAAHNAVRGRIDRIRARGVVAEFRVSPAEEMLHENQVPAGV